MDMRKSIIQGFGENGLNSSFNRRRSNLRKPEQAIDINVNDDNAERAEFREPPSNQSNSSYSINQETIANMSSPQVVEGISQCIKLNTQNKITMKNAFSLKMIDFMSWMVNHKESSTPNLQMAAVGLDISSKIYSLRVDGLHQDILAMAGNLDPLDNQPEKTNEEGNPENDSEATGEDGQSQQKKKKKKRSNPKIFTTIEALQGECETISLAPTMCGEVDCQNTKMLYQKMLPQHCTGSYAISLYDDIIIDEFNGRETDENEPKIPWPPIQIDFNKEFNPMFPDFAFLDWSLEQENSQETRQGNQSSDNLAFDLNASLLPDEPNDQDMNFVETNYDSDENVVACQAQRTGPICRATLENIIEHIPNQALEYSLFNYSVDIRWAGPSHWKIKNFINNKETSKVRGICKQNPMRKKQIVTELTNETLKEVENKFKMRRKNLSLKSSTMKYSWADEKIIRSKKTSNISKTMRTFSFRPNLLIGSNYNKRDAVTNDKPEENNYNDLNETINYCSNGENDIFDNNNENFDNDILEADVIPSGFVGTNLIEAPKLTQKININYVQRAKKLDVRQLKKCIWNELIYNEPNDQENQQSNDNNQNNQNHRESVNANENNPTVKGEKSFAQIFEHLPNKLNKNDAQELSFPIAFVSLLHLANEKNLEIRGKEDYSDLIVRQ